MAASGTAIQTVERRFRSSNRSCGKPATWSRSSTDWKPPRRSRWASNRVAWVTERFCPRSCSKVTVFRFTATPASTGAAALTAAAGGDGCGAGGCGGSGDGGGGVGGCGAGAGGAAGCGDGEAGGGGAVGAGPGTGGGGVGEGGSGAGGCGWDCRPTGACTEQTTGLLASVAPSSASRG